MSTAVHDGMPTFSASTPNDTASSPPATANGRPARTPSRNRGITRGAAALAQPVAAPPTGRVLATCSGVSQARRAVATPQRISSRLRAECASESITIITPASAAARACELVEVAAVRRAR